MTKTTAKKYLSAIKGSKIKNLTCDALSRSMGIYPEIIAENLCYFEPLLMMNMGSYNLRELIAPIEEYIKEQEIIKHKENLYTEYQHCSQLLKNKGDQIKKGDIIAKVGGTGGYAPHLHFEILEYTPTITSSSRSSIIFDSTNATNPCSYKSYSCVNGTLTLK